jgi:hypothetical protein
MIALGHSAAARGLVIDSYVTADHYSYRSLDMGPYGNALAMRFRPTHMHAK